MSKNSVPSPEDFARAKAAMKKADQGLADVRRQIVTRFGSRGVHQVFVLYSRATNSFGVFVFFQSNTQAASAQETGLASEIEGAALQALEEVGRGPKSSLDVRFEYDSHENVQIDFAGNYYNRLR
ncbi:MULTISPECIES: hypothetical protein [Stenotrophomonas]|uniref:hypothetical protein n=1 Tax=Stenotrophomonas TaxID=40323 RepID=UPI00114D114E|nr:MULTISPECIES: hypothetical protein [Stenotrophomonas]